MPRKGAALVTGGAQRLGRAMVLDLARRGYDVAIHYANSAEAAEETVRDARALGVQAVALQADLLELEATQTLLPRACSALGGGLNVLINNASVFEYDTIRTATPASWDRHMNSNLRAPLLLTQGFAEQVEKDARDDQGEPVASGVVINMVDMRVRKLTPEFMTYTLAKWGLWGLTQTTAQGLAPDVRVNAIGPGPTLRATRQSADHYAAQRSSTILGRGSSPAEICAALGFILDSPGLTGQLLCMDGGQHLAWKTADVLGVE